VNKVKYSDLVAKWLAETGYAKCFSLGGGGIMHLVESISRAVDTVPVVHEVAAGIAAEYFNATSEGKKAFALVTTGPGLTNIVTAIAAAYHESRELLVLGGQVKTEDICHGKIRQKGFQEIEGVKLVESITKGAMCMHKPLTKCEFLAFIAQGGAPRKGPIFVEIPLDIQGRMVDPSELEIDQAVPDKQLPVATEYQVSDIVDQFRNAKRPILLLGGGITRETALRVGLQGYAGMGIPIMTTFNGAQTIGSESELYFGRPSMFGQRYSNILLQQSDFVLALGTRLAVIQTGYNWEQFVPLGKVYQVDIDQSELDHERPKIEKGFCVDANDLLLRLQDQNLGSHKEWISYCTDVKKKLPLIEEGVNVTGEGYVSPYKFYAALSNLATVNDVIIPCSSGGAFTCAYQSILQKFGQPIVTDKAMASMGYGLSGAIGAAIANPEKRTILIEGDGGFAQNIQEIGTAAINQLNLKIFIFDDLGYASIRMTQRSYFGGRYVGCDVNTGLGLPNWEKLFAAYDVPVVRLRPGFETQTDFLEEFNKLGLSAFLVTVDPEQTYYPKITSRMKQDGSMESNPLHRMTPPLSEELYEQVAKYLVEHGL
jgi:acetolactate synthase I/II/III large subunit